MATKQPSLMALPIAKSCSNYSLGLSKPNFKLTLSIDRAKFFGKPCNGRLKSFQSKIHSRTIGQRRPVKGYYNQVVGHEYIITYRGSNFKVRINRNFSWTNSDDQPRSAVYLEIRKPTGQLIRWLAESSKHLIAWKTSEAEFAYDFSECEVIKLYRKFLLYAYMKWQYYPFDTDYRTTFYFNNVRKARTTGAKFYLRPLKSPHNLLRLEVTRKRNWFRGKGINNMLELAATRPTVALAGVEFKYYNIETFSEILARKILANEIRPNQAEVIMATFDRVRKVRGLNQAVHYARGHTNRYLLTPHEFTPFINSVLENMAFVDVVNWRKSNNGEWKCTGWNHK